MPVIHTIDLHYLGIPQSIAAYVVIGPDGPVLVEVGPSSTLTHLVKGLAALGFEPQDIRHALVTHIHLDHAGAAGHLARNGTRIWTHEFGAPHLVDPSKLIASATRIYGAQMDRLWGPIEPVPPVLISPVRDGDLVEVCGLRFEAIATPGHAKHHHAFALGDICFAGDAAGITVPGIAPPPKGKYLAIPTPPPEFDLDAWLASIDRLLAREFKTLFVTHYGRVDDPAAHLRRLRELLLETTQWLRAGLGAGHDRDTILERYMDWNRRAMEAEGLPAAEFARYVSTNLLTMNIDGLLRWANARVAESDPHQAQNHKAD